MKITYLWPLLFCLPACGGTPSASRVDAVAGLAHAAPPVPAATPSPAAVNSYEDLVQLIQAGDGHGKPLSSIDDVLAELAQVPANAGGFSLVYASRSLQTASAQSPRVVFFGEGPTNYRSNVRLVVAFPSDPTAADYQTLEVMSQDPTTQAIKLAEIKFPLNGVGAPQFSVDPPRCAVCHGTPARPIWDSYPVWPGVFGSVDDQLDGNTSEFSDFQTLSAKFGKPGRFQYLNVKLGVQVRGVARHGYHRPNDGDTDANYTPNLGLTMVLSQMNYRRMAALAKDLPRFQAVKYALLGVVNSCYGSDQTPSPSAWFPSDLDSKLGFSLQDVQKATTVDVNANETDKLNRYFNVRGAAYSSSAPEDLFGFDVGDEVTVGSLRYAAMLAGSDMRDWSMTLTPRAASFGTGAYGVVDFYQVLLESLTADADYSTLAGNCSSLVTASKAAITPAVEQSLVAEAGKLKAQLASDGVDREPLVLRCMSCHTDPLVDGTGNPRPTAPGDIPYYPFNRIQSFRTLVASQSGLGSALRNAVTAAPTSDERMPKAPRAPLTSAESAAFVDFLNVVAP